MTAFSPALLPADDATLKHDLKVLLIRECDKDVEPASIADDAQLIGGDLALDSLDALQISMAVKQRYGVRIEDGPQARRALQSINSLAHTIRHYVPD